MAAARLVIGLSLCHSEHKTSFVVHMQLRPSLLSLPVVGRDLLAGFLGLVAMMVARMEGGCVVEPSLLRHKAVL